MLEFEVRQLYLEREERYYLPIPKLSPAQLGFISDDLISRGFSVARGERISGRSSDGTRFTISPVGLAWSSAELLDSVVPSIARVLSFPGVKTKTNPYYALKKGHGGFEVHFFPRLEGLGHWTSLRNQGESGLTPDEAVVIQYILRDAEETLDCVTDYPTEGSTPTQAGRHQLYRSRVPASEFASNLRTIATKSSRNVYLPRTSVLGLRHRPRPLDGPPQPELGQWCYLEFTTKTSNP